MANFRENIRKMNPYEPPLKGRASKDYLLLDFNEMTISPSQKVREALREFIDSGRLQAYPEYGDLEAKIAKYAGVLSPQVMVTNGGDQGIDIICRACLDKGDKAIIPFPGFAMHYQSIKAQGAEILEPAYGQDGSFPLKETLDLLSDGVNPVRDSKDKEGVNREQISNGVKLIILCNPNNPLGSSMPIEDVEKILKKAKEKKIAVLHDEAYFEFSGITAKDLVSDFNNLFIVRTFSKAFGLASTRAGYIIAEEDNMQELLKIRGPYDVNMFAKIAVSAALEDLKYMKDYTKEVMEKSKPKLEEFLREKEILFYPSAANFLLLRVQNPQGIIDGLKSKGILVRLKSAHDGKGAIRVSIGTIKDTELFIERFKEVLNEIIN